jgi:hypothetical protein
MAFDPDKYLQSKVKVAPDTSSIPLMEEDSLSLGDVAAMAGQGATLNFGDEILAAIKAGKDVATGKGSLDNILDLYREHQKEEEAKYEALKAANPNLALVGELAGGFLLPGGMIAKGAAKGATALESILAAAKGGAKIGALAGAGSSKADLGNIEELGKDVLAGTAGGAILGGAISTAGQGLSKGIPAIIAKGEQADTPIVRNLAAAARKGFEGKKLLSDTAQKEIRKESEEAASSLETQMAGAVEGASKDIDVGFKRAAELEAKVIPDEEIKEGLALFGRNIKNEGLVTPTVDAKTAKKIAAVQNKLAAGKIDKATAEEQIKKIRLSSAGVAADFEQALSAGGADVSKTPHEMQGTLDKLTSLVKGELNPQEAYNLALELEKLDTELLPQGLVKSLKAAAKESADVALAPESTVGSSPITRAFQKQEDIKTKLPEMLLGEARPEQYQTKQLRDLGYSAPQKIYDTVSKKIIDKLSDPATTGDDARTLITTLEKNIDELNKTYPELNLDFKQVINRIKNVSQDVTLRKKILSEQGKTDEVASGVLDKLTNLLGYGGAYGTGSAVGAVGRGLGKFNNLISSASDATLMPVAKTLQGVKGVSHLGAALEGALNNKSLAAKNAAIFSIMQNPEARNAIKGDLFGTENE